MVSRELVLALSAARPRMTQDDWYLLAGKLAGMKASPDAVSAREVVSSFHNQDVAWILAEAFLKHPGAQWNEISAAMTAIDCLTGDNTPITEIIWTGPSNGRFPIRRIDQVLYDLVASAKERVILVTFAAHRIPHLCQLLSEAVKRGVKLDLIVEREDESQGQLSLNASFAFKNVPATQTRVYYWPLEKREKNQAGRPGKLHVKCAIIDDIALIGSANLTDDAFNRNMELGLLVRDRLTVRALVEHFEELVRTDILVEIK